MEAAAKEFLVKLLETPSPSGYEAKIQDVVRDYVSDFADEVKTDVHGNVIACRNPGAPLRVMLAGHCDQIGLLVTQIDELGFIYTQTIGGWDPQQLIGQRMTIWTDNGPIPAVIARKAIHLLTQEERKQVVKQEDLWLDIGAKDQQEAASLVTIGDPVTLQLGYQEMRNGLANAPGMDDRTGLWVVIEALRRAGKNLNCAMYSVSTVQEEIGLRGAQTSAYGIDPHVGIGVDVTHATDCPTIDKRQQGDIALGKGPVIFRGPNMNPVVTDRLRKLADEHKIAYQLSAVGRAASNDTNALQITRAGVATGLVALPNRYMHSAVEVISLDDIDRAADLLAAFADSLSGEDDFTPRA
ncbi:MAG: M42 family metallopeptidase [Pirellulaceae bacterium]